MINCSINLFAGLPLGNVVDIAKEAEKLGYSGCWVYDEGLAGRDVYVAMTAIAANTQKMRVGTGITNPFTRHPAVTAATIATINEYSGGRAFLGIGAGGSLTLDPLAIERRKPVKAVREMIETTRALYTGESVTYQGEIVKLNGAKIGFAQPDIEIWLAGRGDKMLSLGGELADGVALDFLHKDFLKGYVDIVKSGAEITGNHPKLCYSTMIVMNDRVLEEVRPHMTYRLVDSPEPVKEAIGLKPADVEKIRSEMINHGLEAAGKYVKDEWIKPFVIMGSPSECAAELKQMVANHHIDEFLLPILELKTAVELIKEVAVVLRQI